MGKLTSQQIRLAAAVMSLLGLIAFVVWGFRTHDVLRTTKIGVILTGSLFLIVNGVIRMKKEYFD